MTSEPQLSGRRTQVIGVTGAGKVHSIILLQKCHVTVRTNIAPLVLEYFRTATRQTAFHTGMRTGPSLPRVQSRWRPIRRRRPTYHPSSGRVERRVDSWRQVRFCGLGED